MAVGGGDILTVGLSGLLASQKTLDNISHNIANVNTPGYSRQRVELVTRPPQWSGNQYFGSGVDVAGVSRSYDQFLTRDVQTNTSAATDQRVQHDLAAELDSVLGSSETALAPVLQGFFDSLEDAAADPASLSTRGLLLNQADQLAQRFQTLDARFQQLDGAVQMRTRATVDEINGIAQSIADLNRQIVSSGGMLAQPNDFLDQRDQLVTELAQRVAVTTTTQEDGSMNVFIGTGQTLVMGAQARQLGVTGGGEDASRVGIVISTSGASNIEVTSDIAGGSLGGLLAFDQGMLADAERRIDQLALGVADQINAQHELGMDLRGELGGPFFNDLGTAHLASNTSTAELTVNVESVDKLQNTDYRLVFDGSSYRLIRLSDDSLVQSMTPAELSAAGRFDVGDEGFSIAVSGAMAQGESFLIRPAAGAARGLSVVVPDAQSIALASPVRTAATLGNLGDATIGAAHVANLTGGGPLARDITLTYDKAGGKLDVTDALGNDLGSIDYAPATDSGAALPPLNVAGFGEIRFTITGSPEDGDTFSLVSNEGGASDNHNALALSELQHQRGLSGGTATFAESYTRTVSDVASRTQGLELSASAHEQLLANAQDARESYSGVNLDEEATNLLRYQQAYQAAAKVIAAGNEIFQVLLSAVGR